MGLIKNYYVFVILIRFLYFLKNIFSNLYSYIVISKYKNISNTKVAGILKNHNIRLSLKLVKNSLYIELLKWVQVLLLFIPIYF